METAVPWVAVAASLLGLAFAWLVPALSLPRASAAGIGTLLIQERRSFWRPVAIASVVLAAALLAGSLPTRPPWSGGQILGRAVVLGAAAGLLAAWWLRRLGERVVRSVKPPPDTALHLCGLAGATGILATGLLAVAAAVLLFPLSRVDALNGVALGALLVAGLHRLACGLHRTDFRMSDGAVLQAWALCVAGLCAATAFGVLHFTRAQALARFAPVGVLAVALLTLIMGAAAFGAAPSTTRVFAGTGGISALVTGALALFVLPRLVPAPGAALVALLGLGTALLTLLLAAAAQPDADGAPESYGTEAAALMALMALGLFVAAFQSLRGYGVGLALVAAWAVGGSTLAALCWRDLAAIRAAAWPELPPPDETAAGIAGPLHRLLGVVLLAALFRLFLQRYHPLATDLTLTVHFSLVGLLAGALFPALLAASIQRAEAARAAPGGTWGSLWFGIGLGAWTVLLPASAGIAWGPRALVGMLAGLLVAGMYGLFGAPRTVCRAGDGMARDGALLLSVVMALVMVQGAHLLEAFGMVPRATRAGAVVGVGLLGFAWLMVGAWLGQRKERSAAEPPPASRNRLADGG